MQVSQIFLTNDGGHEVPPVLSQFNATVQAGFPQLPYVRYDNATLRAFMTEHYDERVVAAYDRLRSYSNKADLGRYALLHALGGWYFDMGIRLHTPVELADHIDMVAFREIQKFTGTCWACMTAVIFSKPGNPALRYAIEQVVKNVESDYYGITPLSPTATPVLGQALAKHGEHAGIVFGDFLQLTPTHEKQNTAFVLPDGTILAWGKPAGGGDLSALGAKGTNNYNELWHKRALYA